MPLPTEPVGSVPRTPDYLEALRHFSSGQLSASQLAEAGRKAVRETVEAMEATGSPVITDGEQTKPSFATYPVHGLPNLAPDGAVIPFADGHSRQLPRLTAGPFRYATFAEGYLAEALQIASVPVKQAVISASALSLLYPGDGIPGYDRESFLADLVDQTESDVRRCLERGAHAVQMDFTEGRLSVKLDPSGGLLQSFVDLNNRVLDRFSESDRSRLGVHTCPGGDHDSTHSADVDYAELLPRLFQLNAGRFYVQLASESDRRRVLRIIAENSRPDQRVFVGVVDPIDPVVETPTQVRDRVLEAAEFIDPERLGTTDDCGFSPFADDVSTARETAFEKIRARVEGTKLADRELGLD